MPNPFGLRAISSVLGKNILTDNLTKKVSYCKNTEKHCLGLIIK